MNGDAPGRRAWPLAALGAALVVLLFSIYRAGLGGPLLLDDSPVIEPLLAGGRLAPDWRSQVWSTTGPLGRPLAILSFVANAAAGGGDIYWWKLTNLALHLATALALWWVASGIMRAARRGAPARPAYAGLAVAALWLLHPLQVSTVLYTVQRMTILSALFVALGIGAYLAGRRAMQRGRSGVPGILTAYGLCLPLAAFSKESGLLLPCFLALIEFIVLAPRGAERRAMLRLHAALLALPALAVAIYYATHYEQALVQAYAARGMTLPGRLMTECRVLVSYLAQIVTPASRQLGFFHDDIARSTGWLAPPTTAASALLLLGLLAGASALRQRLPIVSVGILFFFAGHLLESTIIPLELMFEHRNYLPSFGIVLAVAGGVLALGPAYARFRITCGALALGLLVLLTWAQAGVWSRLETLLPASYALHPRSETAAANLAELLSNGGRPDVALAVLAKIPTAGARLHERYLHCRRDGRLADGALGPALLAGEDAVGNYVVTGLIELAKLGLDDACRYDLGAFGALLSTAAAKPIAIASNRYKLLLYEAHIAWKSGDREGAVARLERARALASRDATPAMLEAEWLLAMGETARAAELIGQARELLPADRADMHNMLAGLERALEAERAKQATRDPGTQPRGPGT